MPASLTTQPGFWVGHLFTPYGVEISTIKEIVNRHFSRAELNLLLLKPKPVTTELWGKTAGQTALLLAVSGVGES